MNLNDLKQKNENYFEIDNFIFLFKIQFEPKQ